MANKGTVVCLALLGDLNLQDWKMMDDHKSRGWIMQDWQMKDEVAGVENDGLAIEGRDRRSGQCRTGK